MKDLIKEVGRPEFGVNRPDRSSKPDSEPQPMPQTSKDNKNWVEGFKKQDRRALGHGLAGSDRDWRQTKRDKVPLQQAQASDAQMRLNELQRPTGSTRTH